MVTVRYSELDNAGISIGSVGLSRPDTGGGRPPRQQDLVHGAEAGISLADERLRPDGRRGHLVPGRVWLRCRHHLSGGESQQDGQV